MLDPEDCLQFLANREALRPREQRVLSAIGFADPQRAAQRIRGLAQSESEARALAVILPALLYAFDDAADADIALRNLERFAHVAKDRARWYQGLAQSPRAIEILVKLFVGSQHLTEILIRNPKYLEQLTNHRRLAEFKSREDFLAEGKQWITWAPDRPGRFDELRRFQQWELLRVAACDTFGLFDFKTVVLQLSLLADSILQLVVEEVSRDFPLDWSQFTVLAFGKLGGEELNYSSDIDLVFVCREQAEAFWKPSQRFIKALTDMTPHGFLYRVDMRLRPWGKSGPLVTTLSGYCDYLQKHARHWERQALLKARPVAGNLAFGKEVLKQLHAQRDMGDFGEIRSNIRGMKRSIEDALAASGRNWGEVKGGPGGIRDIEFLTQWLQLRHGRECPAVYSPTTLDGLARLSELEFILPGEYRHLSHSYTFLRTVEHALQVMHNQQEHSLPTSQRAQGYLARRLDFPDAATFADHYQRHTAEVRKIFLSHLGDAEEQFQLNSSVTVADELGSAAAELQSLFTEVDEQKYVSLLGQVGPGSPVKVAVRSLDDDHEEVTIAGFDKLGELSVLCGVLFAMGCDIRSGEIFTGLDPVPEGSRLARKKTSQKFINMFVVRRKRPTGCADPFWKDFEADLTQLLHADAEPIVDRLQGTLIDRVARKVVAASEFCRDLLPMDIDVDAQSDPLTTILRIRCQDVPGFLYELTNALAMAGLSVVRMRIQTVGNQVRDELRVVNSQGKKIVDERQLNQLRAAIVLIQHFIHLLPQAPNPASALHQFRELLHDLLQRPEWHADLARLDDSEVLQALSRLLGGSESLWEDFLRMQHENLFPVVTEVARLKTAKNRDDLTTELQGLIQAKPHNAVDILNEFKDREILRIDLRHVLGLQDLFGMFSRELTALAECVVSTAVELACQHLTRVYGPPLASDGRPAAYAVCALGKFGGEELGYASDIELMLVYSGQGQTSGPKVIPTTEFFERLVEQFRQYIHARHRRIFEIDLRLRPYGQAGNLAVSIDQFEKYFAAEGPAWPYERQSLVKLRPIAGDPAFGNELTELRDRLIYTDRPFDVVALRAMREKQLRQLVQPDKFNAKLSLGGVVDCEYVVQALQITHGHANPALRCPNTREALKALEVAEILSGIDRRSLRDAYRFLRRLIDALRMVRGDATDLNVPAADTDQFEFLARRMGYTRTADLQRDLESHVSQVRLLSEKLLTSIVQKSA